MSMDHTIQDASKRLKVHSTLSILTLVVAIILLAFMITVESEPGAIPLLLLVIGIGWYFVTRARIRALHQ